MIFERESVVEGYTEKVGLGLNLSGVLRMYREVGRIVSIQQSKEEDLKRGV